MLKCETCNDTVIHNITTLGNFWSNFLELKHTSSFVQLMEQKYSLQLAEAWHCIIKTTLLTFPLWSFSKAFLKDRKESRPIRKINRFQFLFLRNWKFLPDIWSSLENYTRNNTRQYETTQVQHDTTRNNTSATRDNTSTKRDNASTKQHKIYFDLFVSSLYTRRLVY